MKPDILDREDDYRRRWESRDRSAKEIGDDLDSLISRVRARLSYDESAEDMLYHLKQAKKAYDA